MLAPMHVFDALLREAFVVCAVLTLPVIAGATLVGAVVAVVQAATQVQEQSLSLLPKLIVVGVLVGCFGPFALGLCALLVRDALAAIPALVRG